MLAATMILFMELEYSRSWRLRKPCVICRKVN